MVMIWLPICANVDSSYWQFCICALLQYPRKVSWSMLQWKQFWEDVGLCILNDDKSYVVGPSDL